MGSSMDSFASSGGIGLIGTAASGIGSYFGAQAQGIATKGSYMAQAASADASASQALLESSAMSNQYKVGAINMIMQAQARQAEYDYAAARFEMEGKSKSSQADLFESEAGIKLLEQVYIMRNASIMGASALDIVRTGAEEEARLREEGAKFKGTQRSSIAAGGTDVTSGSALDILRDTDEGIESDSAAIRFTAQKNRWKLLVQQQNMWMAAAVKDMESKQYEVAAEGMRGQAGISDLAASTMTQIGNLALQSGEAGSEHYNALAEMAQKSGLVTSQGYNTQSEMFKNMGNIAQRVSNATAIGGLLGTVAPVAGNFIGNKQSQGSQFSSPQQPRAQFMIQDSQDAWNSLAFTSGIDKEIKFDTVTMGNFLPNSTVQGYQKWKPYKNNWGLGNG